MNRLADALRALIGLPTRSLGVRASIGEVSFWLAVFFVLGLAFQWWALRSGVGRWRVQWWMLPAPFVFFSTLAWFAWLLERASAQVVAGDRGVLDLESVEERHNPRVLLHASAVFVSALALALLCWLAGALLPGWPAPWSTIWFVLALAWFGWQALARVGVWPATRGLSLIAALVPVIAVLILEDRFPPEPTLVRQADPAVVQDRLASDEIWEAQEVVLTQKLEAMQSQRPNVSDVYFVSFAPDAQEDVFLRETNALQLLMETRFDTHGRALRLINHASQYRSAPAATVAHLRRSLIAIGKKIDPAQDVVVLYLTGHGSARHDLVARADTMQLKHLRPEVLHQLLNEAGIRYAVIAVSSCYSGGWIAPLASPQRLVMTASASDKTSFGCGNDSDFTYWGRAVFDEGLRTGFSFEQAFTEALPRIKAREALVGQAWSDPQIAVGEAIRPVLNALEVRLANRSRVVIPVSESAVPPAR